MWEIGKAHTAQNLEDPHRSLTINMLARCLAEAAKEGREAILFLFLKRSS